jgi:hypothetical protein
MTTMQPLQCRSRRNAGVLALAAMLTLAAGCATQPAVRSDEDPSVQLAKPASATSRAADCNQIDSEIVHSVEVRRVAGEQSENAWKAVVPFVVLARKASAKSALEEADKNLAALKAQAQRCEPGDAR